MDFIMLEKEWHEQLDQLRYGSKKLNVAPSTGQGIMNKRKPLPLT